MNRRVAHLGSVMAVMGIGLVPLGLSAQQIEVRSDSLPHGVFEALVEFGRQEAPAVVETFFAASEAVPESAWAGFAETQPRRLLFGEMSDALECEAPQHCRWGLTPRNPFEREGAPAVGGKLVWVKDARRISISHFQVIVYSGMIHADFGPLDDAVDIRLRFERLGSTWRLRSKEVVGHYDE